MPDFRLLDRRALDAAEAMVARVTADRLGAPSPCDGWTLGDLLAHMAGQNHGFAAAARGSGADPDAWRDRPPGDDPAAVFAASAADVTAAFAGEGVLDGRWLVRPISTERPVRGTLAITFHFVDYVVHAWDVAASVGATGDLAALLDDEVVTEALRVAEAVPGGPGREVEGAAFRPALPVPPGASMLARTLLLLGRTPAWRP